MALNYDVLTDVEPVDINISRIGAGEETLDNIKNYTRDDVGSYWLNFTSFALFIMLVAWFIVKKDYPVSQAVLNSSILTLVVVFAFTVTGFSKNLYPLFFYGTIVFISMAWVYTNKKKGLIG